MEILPWEIQVVFPRENQLRQSNATQPTVHAECFSVSIIIIKDIWHAEPKMHGLQDL